MPLPRDVFALSDDQFNKLIELLTPGYEVSKIYLAQYQEGKPATASEPKDPPNNGDDVDLKDD
jgi:hypothetical protein